MSGVGDPPDIAHLDIPSSPGPVPDLASLDSIKGITVSPTDKYFHVAVFLREDAPSTGNFSLMASHYIPLTY